MTQVNIRGTHHTVEIQHDGADLIYVIEKAQKLYDETKPAEKGINAVGFIPQANGHSEAVGR